MEEGVPTVAVTGVASRFVSQTDIETAKARRDEQWKAAYARLGQEPPPQPTEDSYDGRSLAEKLAANRAAKQEEWEEKTKLANQFRALEEDEIMFLDSIREKEAEEERLRKLQDGEELSDFRKAVAARENAMNNPPPTISKTAPPPPPEPKPKPASDVMDKSKGATPAPRKDASAKKALKGVIVKKETQGPSISRTIHEHRDLFRTMTDSQPVAKRRKM
ncbi:N-terminal domain of NEFA-interacting nuclear protein NIP30-domain-containing protein [Melanogaster broomeanus]|nr:N-terminal domain of NEFA-interacting nuclear protein NIP30-domain-containing protein [Melanogaster broomeanus]